MARSLKFWEAAEEIGCSESFLYEHCHGTYIDMGGGQTIQVIRVGRFMRIPTIAIARYLGEAPALEAAQ